MVEVVHLLWREPLVPVALVHTHNLPALIAYSTVGEEVGWVDENHVELEVELWEQLEGVAVKNGERLVL